MNCYAYLNSMPATVAEVIDLTRRVHKCGSLFAKLDLNVAATPAYRMALPSTR